MSKRMSIISNVTIAVTLLVISLAIFTTDLSDIYTSVAAPVYNGNVNEKNVSIMVNVDRGNEFLGPMMNVLEEKGVQATFFVGGTWASQNMTLVKELGERFELGNHAYTQKDLKKMSEARQRAEISNTHVLLKSITDREMNLFAPPQGSFSKTTLKTAEGLGYVTIMWSKDTVDWRDKDSKIIYTRATENLKNGDLVLMHPTAETLKVLPDIIDFYKSSGFNVVEVGKNITH